MCPVKKKAKHNEDVMPIDNGNDDNDGDNDSNNTRLRRMNGGGSTVKSTSTGTPSAAGAPVMTNRSRQIQDNDVVNLHDYMTGRHIKNSTRVFAEKENDDKLNKKINVRVALPELGNKSIPLRFDESPLPREVKKYAESFAQYACAISAALWSGKNPLVFCKNGRSRSPSVVAAFFILFRGVTYNFIRNWMNEVYPAQRSVTAKISVDFPNLDRFENILKYIEDAVVKSDSPDSKHRRNHLSGVLKYCSNVYGKSMLAGSYAWFDGHTDGLDPLSILPLYNVTSTSLPPSPPENRRMTRNATKRRLSIPANGLTIARQSNCALLTTNEMHCLQQTVTALRKENDDLRRQLKETLHEESTYDCDGDHHHHHLDLQFLPDAAAAVYNIDHRNVDDEKENIEMNTTRLSNISIKDIKQQRQLHPTMDFPAQHVYLDRLSRPDNVSKIISGDDRMQSSIGSNINNTKKRKQTNNNEDSMDGRCFNDFVYCLFSVNYTIRFVNSFDSSSSCVLLYHLQNNISY